MNKNVLLFAWEYWGKHSKPGAALARRITQVAETFCDNGWTVNVIYNDHRNESQSNPYIITTTDKGIRLIGIKQTQSSDPVKENKLIRPVNTFLHVLFKGDRSNKWAKDVQREFANLKIPTPQLIIGF